MCGIVGVIHFDGSSVDSNVLAQASRCMKHRGPDDEDIWVQGPVGLAHQRLSILDLSAAGRQPMISSDGHGVLVYNGEFYNFAELKPDLQRKGYKFRSHSDTEVLLYGFLHYGPDFVHKINGMFAFGFWDTTTRRMTIMRDRLGVKPLYYYHGRDRFYFASEVKALLRLGIPAELEPTAVSSYFSLRYCPGEQTMFKGIKKLTPGHYLDVGLDGSVREKTYWNLLSQSELLPYTFAQASDRFFDLLEDAVRLRQIADVPVGAFLSGGIDSSAITALMKKNKGNVETFTFGMGADIDESNEARRIAEHLGVNNTLIPLDKDDYKLYETAVRHLEEPLGDSIIVPTYVLAREAVKKVKVVELGEGADEILGGYVHQLAMTYGDRLGRVLPEVVRNMIPGIAARMPQFFWDKVFPYPAQLGKSGVGKIANYLSRIEKPGEAYLELTGFFNTIEKRQIFGTEFYHDAIAPHPPERLFETFFQESRNPVFQNRLLQNDLRYWNADYSMLRMDKLTMAHGLEARVPYLDYRLVEFCLRLPREFKTKGFKQKLLLRRALAGKHILPPDVIAAKKKSFYLPIEKCFDARFESYLRDTLSEANLKRRGIFNVAGVQALLNAERELVTNKQLMILLIFELWCRQFLDGRWNI